jgi:hypothetical protein
MNLPKQNIPESKKTEQWHLDCVNAIVHQHKSNGSYDDEARKDFENYLIVQGKFDNKQYEYVTDMYGITSPARLVNYPMILPKLDLLAGELISQDLSFTVNVINKNALRKKNEEKLQIAAETILRPIRRKIEETIGQEIPDENVGQEVPVDVEEFMSMNFRTNVENMADAGLKYLIQKWDLKNLFKRGFYDMGITSKEFYRVFIKNGDPCVERIDPRKMIVDYNSKLETIKDSKYAGHQDWYTINEVLDEFRDKLKPEQVTKLEELETENNREVLASYNLYNSFYYDEEENGIKVSVTHAEWRSLKTVKFKVSDNPYDPDSPYYKRVKADYKPKKGEKVVDRVITEIRRATKIGQDMMVDYGPRPNQVRHEENYTNTTLSYHGVIRNKFTGSTVSVVDALKNIQILINIVVYHIEVSLSRSGGKAVVYDVSQKPKKMPLDDVLYHAKNSGLIVINSQQEGMPSSFNQFQQVDFTLSQSVGQMINLKAMLEETADRLTGISAARSGVQKSGDLVGVTERNVMQSSLITAPLFDMHYTIVGDVLQGMADLMKIAWSKEGRIANILGDTGMQMFNIDKSIALEELGIFIENSAKDNVKRQSMMGMMERMASTGSIDPITMMKTINADNSSEVEAIITAGLKSVQAQQTELEERKVAAQEQSNEIEGQKIQVPLQVAKIESDTDLKIAEMKLRGEQSNTDKELEQQAFKEEQDRDNEMDKIALQAGMNTNNQAQQATQETETE